MKPPPAQKIAAPAQKIAEPGSPEETTQLRPAFKTTIGTPKSMKDLTEAPDSKGSNVSDLSKDTGQSTIYRVQLEKEKREKEELQQKLKMMEEYFKEKAPELMDNYIASSSSASYISTKNDINNASSDSDNNENDSDIDLEDNEEITKMNLDLETQIIGKSLETEWKILQYPKKLENTEDILDDDKTESEETIVTVGTSVISQFIIDNFMKQTNNKLVTSYLREKNVSKIFNKYFPHIDYESVRNVSEAGDTPTKQFITVWGKELEVLAKSDKYCCYLCGGKLVNNDIVTPEMEHKLPAIEFFCKAHNIQSKFPNLLGIWHTYIANNNNNELIELYNFINCYQREKSDQTIFQTGIDNKFDAIMVNFAASEHKLSSDENYEKFKMLLKINLMEFAFSHHTCNQIKTNDNFRNKAGVYNVEKYLNKVTEVLYDDKHIGFLNGDKFNHEHDIVRKNMFIIKKTSSSSKVKPYSVTFLENTMRILNFYIVEYAKLHQDKNGDILTVKRLMVQSIKGMIKHIKEIADEKNENSIRIERNNRFDYLRGLILNKIEKYQKEINEQQASLKARQRSSRSTRSSNSPDKTNDYHKFLLDKQTELNELKGLYDVLQKELPKLLTDALADLKTAKENIKPIPLGGKKPKSKWAIKRKNRTLKKKKK